MIYLATDHRGFVLKEKLKNYLVETGCEIEDMGAFSYDKDDDYPDFAAAAAEKVSEDLETNRAILLCGSGHGADIVANKFRGVRAALCWNTAVAKQSREHDGANVLVLSADWLTEEQAREIVSAWLETGFSGEERHQRRIKKIEETETKNFR